jgi:hypothetical protein
MEKRPLVPAQGGKASRQGVPASHTSAVSGWLIAERSERRRDYSPCLYWTRPPFPEAVNAHRRS